MDKRKEKIIQEIVKLKSTQNITVENKKKIQKLQQELDQIERNEPIINK